MEFEEHNNCFEYSCDSTSIKLSKSFNKYCLESHILMNYTISNNIWSLMIFYGGLLIVHTISSILGSYISVFCKNRRNKKKMLRSRNIDILKHEISILDIPLSEDYIRELWVLSLQGNNTPERPWYLEIEMPEEMKVALTNYQYSTIIRVILLLNIRK